MRLLQILLLIDFVAPLLIHAQALDRKFAEQDLDKERTYEICSKQYDGPHYFSVHKTALDPSYDEFVEFNDISGIRFIKTTKGVQSIFSSVEQQSSGKWKCKRGPIEDPMAIGKEYKTSTPIYKFTPPDCWLHSRLLLRHSLSLLRPSWERPCTSKIVGYQTKRRMLKEEKCTKGGTCLVLYKQSAEGKTARRVIGVSVASLEKIFPYSKRRVYAYTSSTDGEIIYEILLGPDDLNCSTFSGIGDENFLKRRYKLCLEIESAQWL